MQLLPKQQQLDLSTDYVDKSVNDLKNNFENLFGQTFDENGTIPRLLAENFGEDGKVITELLNPDKSWFTYAYSKRTH